MISCQVFMTLERFHLFSELQPQIAKYCFTFYFTHKYKVVFKSAGCNFYRNMFFLCVCFLYL